MTFTGASTLWNGGLTQILSFSLWLLGQSSMKETFPTATMPEAKRHFDRGDRKMKPPRLIFNHYQFNQMNIQNMKRLDRNLLGSVKQSVPTFRCIH